MYRLIVIAIIIGGYLSATPHYPHISSSYLVCVWLHVEWNLGQDELVFVVCIEQCDVFRLYQETPEIDLTPFKVVSGSQTLCNNTTAMSMYGIIDIIISWKKVIGCVCVCVLVNRGHLTPRQRCIVEQGWCWVNLGQHEYALFYVVYANILCFGLCIVRCW